MSIKRNYVAAVLAIVLAVFAGSSIATAKDRTQSDYRSESFTIVEGDTHEGALYAAGSTLTIAGTVKGDVYCGMQTVNITGTVEGDVICGASTIRVGGVVKGDVRLAGQSVSLNGAVDGTATVFAQTLDVGRDAKISSDLNGAAGSAVVSGSVGRDVLFASGSMMIDGTVGRNLGGEYEQLSVVDGASVGGYARYTSETDAAIAENSVRGEVVRSEPVERAGEWESGEFITGAAVYFFFSMLLIALVLALLAPRLVHSVSDNGTTRLMQSILVGFFAVFGMPIVLFLLAMTVVGIPLAGVLLVAWLLVILLSGPVFGYYLGRVIMQNRTVNPLLIMLVGSSVLLLAYFVPVANVFAALAAGIVGSGMIVLSLGGRYQKPVYTVANKTVKPVRKK